MQEQVKSEQPAGLSANFVKGPAGTIHVGQIEIRYLRDGARSRETGAFEMVIPPGSNVPPPHSHSNNEEYLYVLDGKIRYQVNGVTEDLTAGQCAYTPKGAVHGFSNPFSESVRALVVLTPDIGAQYFVDVAAVLSAGGPPDRQRLLNIMEQYGLKVTPPKA